MRTILTLLLFGFLVLLADASQAGSNTTALQEPARSYVAITSSSAPVSLSNDEAKELERKLQLANETPIKFENDQLAPVVIKDARIRYVKRDHQEAAGDETDFSAYALSARITLANATSSDIKGLILELRSDAALFQLYRVPKSFAAGASYDAAVDFMCLSADPSLLLVKLAGARLGEDVYWGKFPLVLKDVDVKNPRPDRQPSSLPTGIPSSRAATQESSNTPHSAPRRETSSVTQRDTIDSRPVARNAPMPRYSELARRNGVMGSASLRILIGSDGAVKQVKVVRGLPDFLTEEAIRAAFSLRFSPAMKDGQGVGFWQNVLVEFNLR